MTGTEQPTTNLSPCFSDLVQGKPHPITDIPAPPYQPASARGQLGDVSSPLLER